MFGFKKNKPTSSSDQNAASSTDEEAKATSVGKENESAKKPGFFARLTQGLKRTRSGLTDGVANLVLGKKAIDDEVLEEVEALLLTADVGIEATQSIIDDLTQRLKRNQLKDAETLFEALAEDMTAILEPVSQPLQIPTSDKPFVILMVGMNGAGKTTTIGKLARRFKDQGFSVMLAAGDTFRAAAVEQLQAWGKRNEVPVIAQQSGADPAAVIFDAWEAAKARGIDVLLADTAGRLQSQRGLMDELAKIRRVVARRDETAPHEIMLVLDASQGQNALVQAEKFNDALGLTGITVTKLDGTAKGGILLAIASALHVPVRFIGIGESAEDMQPFVAEEFVDALLASGGQD